MPLPIGSTLGPYVIAALEHPHICPLYDVGDQNGTSFLVMQHLDGETWPLGCSAVRSPCSKLSPTLPRWRARWTPPTAPASSIAI